VVSIEPFCEEKAMNKEVTFAMAWVVLLLAGCVAPQPQVVYVPYPQPAQTAPAPAASPAPVAAWQSEEDWEGQRAWRRFCIETASEVDKYVHARDEGFDFTVVRDWALEREAQNIEDARRVATTRAEHEDLDALADITLVLTQRMIQRVYERPFGNLEYERRGWIEYCLQFLD
jgi:hypothetical protein